MEGNQFLHGMRVEHRLAADALRRQHKRAQKREERERDRERRDAERRSEAMMELSRQQSQELLNVLRRRPRSSQERDSGEEEEEKASELGLFFCGGFGVVKFWWICRRIEEKS